MSGMTKESFLQDANLDDPTSFGQCGDNVFWKNIDDILYIGGSGDMWDYLSPGFEPDLIPTYRDNAEYHDVVILEGVTSIGSMAFFEDIIYNITIPKSVKIIKAYAFFKCTIYNKLEFSESIQTIENDVIAGDPCGVNTFLLSVNIPNIMPTAFYSRYLFPKKIILTGELPENITPLVKSLLFHYPEWSHIYYPRVWDTPKESFYEKLTKAMETGIKIDSYSSTLDYTDSYYQDLKKALIPADD